MKSTKADELALRLEEAIVSGEIPPGSVLRQDRLAEQYHVSRTPVREALRRLSAFGLVSFQPNRGFRVRELSRELFREMFLIRAALEAAAAARAAEVITSEQLAELRYHEREFADLTHRLRTLHPEDAETEGLALEWVQANDRFHDVILRAAGLPILEGMARGVRRVFLGLASWQSGPFVDELFEQNLRQHRAIVAALAAGSSSAAELVREHLVASEALLEAALDEVGPRSAD
jgi:DNA-binding GntR family transcriptional regulator